LKGEFLTREAKLGHWVLPGVIAKLNDILYTIAQNSFVQDGTKSVQADTKKPRRGGRPRKFDEGEALAKMQRQLWTTGLSGASLDGIARSAGLNRPSLASAFGDKDAIYVRAAAQYTAMMRERMSQALSIPDLKAALEKAFDTAIDIYTMDGPDGCFVLCTAPAEALTNPVCRLILDQAIKAIDASFLERLQKESTGKRASLDDLSLLAAQIGATLHSVALRARAGWNREKLRSLAAGTIAQALVAVESSRVSTRSGKMRRTAMR
jgi:AcrR family transcriptional regulator